MFADALLTGIV